MKVALPYYVVGLVAGFVYALVKYYVPTLPFTEDQVLYVILVVLTLLHIDVINALRVQGLLRIK